MTENSDIQSRNWTKDRELDKAQQQLREKVNAKANLIHKIFPDFRKEEQLQSSNMERATVQQQLMRAEETIRREQQQIQEMRQRVSLMWVWSFVCLVTSFI